MFTDILARDLCDHLKGTFVPVGAVPPEGDARGDEPAAGRFWLRRCAATSYLGRLVFELDGVGWIWVGRSQWGFGVDQYAYFTAHAGVGGNVDVTYDSSSKIANIEFHPIVPPRITTGASNELVTHTNVGAGVLNVLSLGLLGNYADGRAAGEFSARLQAAFESRFGRGFVIQYAVDRQQVDAFVPGSMRPPHPISDGSLRWLVNERQELHRAPGALHVTGPFAPTQGANIDVNVVEGQVRYRAVCSGSIEAALDPQTHSLPLVLPPVAGERDGIAGLGRSTAGIAMPCEWYFVTEPVSEVALVDVRVRAAPPTPVPGL